MLRNLVFYPKLPDNWWRVLRWNTKTDALQVPSWLLCAEFMGGGKAESKETCQEALLVAWSDSGSGGIHYMDADRLTKCTRESMSESDYWLNMKMLMIPF